MSEKIIGYLLLIVGLAIIVYSGFNIYNVFTQKSEPVQFFNFSSISLDLSNMLSGNIPEEQLSQMKESGQTKTQLIDSGLINKPINFVAHIVIMGFFASIGFKIASIGAMLVRPIKVKLREIEHIDKKPSLIEGTTKTQ